MGRFVRLASFLAFLLVSPVEATNHAAAACGTDALLVWPVSSFGDLPPSTLTALDMEGKVTAQFPMDRPVSVHTANVADRALAQLDDDSLQIVDISTGVATPLPIEKYKGEQISVGEPLSPDSTLLPVTSGRMNWIVDLASGDIFDLGRRVPVDFFAADDGFVSDVSIVISPDKSTIVMSTLSEAYVGPIRSNEPMTALFEDLRGIEFSPDSSQLLLYIRGFQGDNDQWKVYDISSGEMSDVLIPVELATVGGWSFLDNRSLIGVDGINWYVLDLQTGATKHYQVDYAFLEIVERSSDGTRLLMGWPDGFGGYFPALVLDLTTGESFPFDQVVNGLHSLGDVNMRAGDRVIVPTNGGILVINLAAGELRESAQIYGDSVTFGEAHVLAGGTHAVVVGAGNGTERIVSAIDLRSDKVVEIARPPVQPTVSASPDGCLIAVGTFEAANDRRDAPIDVYDLEGVLIHHFDNAVLIGWAPGP